MPEQSDLLMYGVAAAAFVAGYALVSFIIKHLKALKERPPLNEELWRQHEESQRNKSRGPDQIEGDDGSEPPGRDSVQPLDKAPRD
jgi:hypothetical protein